MASYNSYGSASSRRSVRTSFSSPARLPSYSYPPPQHRSHHQPPQTIVWSLPTVQGVQGPPSALYATYFPPNPHMKYHPRHYSYSPSAMAPIYPAPMPTHPNPSRTRRQSTGDGPRVSPHIIEPTPSYHAQSNSHSRVHPPAPQPAHSYSHLTRKSILKPSKVAPPPQTPYVRD